MPFSFIGPAIAVGSAVYGMTAGSDAISSGKQEANAMAQKAIDTGQANYTQDRATWQPFVNQGTSGLNAFADILGVNGADKATSARNMFTASPGYGYQVEQGLRAVDAGASAKGMLRSGATLKAEQTLGSNLANQDFGNYVGRLNSLANYGVQGASGQAQSTGMFDNLLNEQSKAMQSTTTSAAGTQASQYDAFGKQITNVGNALGSSLNTLYGSGAAV